MHYWLMKAEPDSRVVKGKEVKFSVDDFEKINITPWEGVRNHSAKLNMKSMQVGDKVLFYHSNCKTPGVAAIAEVHKEAYPDYTAWDSTHPYYDIKSDSSKPTWFMVDLQFKSRLQHFVSLAILRHLEGCTQADLAGTGANSNAKGEEDEEHQSDRKVDNGEASREAEAASPVAAGLSYLTEEDLEAIKSMPLLTQGRLSVQGVSETAFNAITKLGEHGGWDSSSLGKKKAAKSKTAGAKADTKTRKQPTGKKGAKPAPTYDDDDDATEGERGPEKDTTHPPKRRKTESTQEESPEALRRSSRRK